MTTKKMVILPDNKKGNDYWVGDIHSRYDLLFFALGSVNFNFKTDRLFCTGDLIDKGNGPNEECLRLLQKPWFFSVRGNHDEMLLNGFYDKFDREIWFKRGGRWILNKPEHTHYHLAKLVESMPLAMTITSKGHRVGLVHAMPNLVWHSPLTVNNIRSRDWVYRKKQDIVEGIDLVVIGHTVVSKPMRFGNCIALDTGAHKTGKLVILSTEELFAI